MHYRIYLTILLAGLTLMGAAQRNTFTDSTNAFFNQYIKTHDVITGEDKKYFRFYKPDESFRVLARFTRQDKSKWFQMETTGRIKQSFRIYGTAQFSIHDTTLTLNIYQSQGLLDDNQYKNYLFLPFTDLTTGNETYEAGRYLDLSVQDIVNGQMVIDFNKAYNPSCAYGIGKYNCPVPPRENSLPIAVKAGEMNFGKPH